MGPSIPFNRLIHADWSCNPGGRWMAEAVREGAGWSASGPRKVGPLDAFVDVLFIGQGPTLAGFDFPIGVPLAFATKTQFSDFLSALGCFGSTGWSDFYNVADRAEEISLQRPFYPRVSRLGVRRKHLVEALGVDSFDALRRRCERKTEFHGAACPLFWTLGANQVGRAAIAGWQEVIVPGRERGAALWPFDGALAETAHASRVTLAETYPAEAYSHVGVRFKRGQSKLNPEHRKEAARNLISRSVDCGVMLSTTLETAIREGFSDAQDGADDGFDAVMGLLGMIEVVEGRRPEKPLAAATDEAKWEGWILGMAAPPAA